MTKLGSGHTCLHLTPLCRQCHCGFMYKLNNQVGTGRKYGPSVCS